MVWPTLGSRTAEEQNRTVVTDRQRDRPRSRVGFVQATARWRLLSRRSSVVTAHSPRLALGMRRCGLESGPKLNNSGPKLDEAVHAEVLKITLDLELQVSAVAN